MKLVSLIITTYKGDKYLERTLKTVVNQTYQNLEIIVVDDNGYGTSSQKKSEKIIGKFKENIEYIIHEKNKNGAAARNTALLNCHGDYICFLDDDDLILPNRIDKCVKVLESEDVYDAVYTDVICADEKLRPTKLIEIRKKGNCYKEIMLESMFFGTGSNIFITKKAYKEIGLFDEKFTRHQDLEFMIRFYRTFKSTFIPEILIVKSKNGTNNIPDYKKLLETKRLFFEKFEREIENMTVGEREKLIAHHNEELERANDKKKSKDSKVTLKKWCNYIVYNQLPKLPIIFPLMNFIRKKIKYLFLREKINPEVFEFLKKYRKETL